MTTFEFIVFGDPQPKGSMRAFVPKGWNRPVVTSTNRNLKAWEALVRSRANDARQGAEPIAGPVKLEIDFLFQRPKRLLTKRTAAVFQPHVSAPDLTKLARGLEDALSGVLFLDDKQVCALVATKAYAPPGAGSFCRVRVAEYYPAQLTFGAPIAAQEAAQPANGALFEAPAAAVQSTRVPKKRQPVRAEAGF